MTNPTPTTMLLTTKYICNHFEVGRLATLLPGSAAFLLFTRVHRLSKFRAYVPYVVAVINRLAVCTQPK